MSWQTTSAPITTKTMLRTGGAYQKDKNTPPFEKYHNEKLTSGVGFLDEFTKNGTWYISKFLFTWLQYNSMSGPRKRIIVGRKLFLCAPLYAPWIGYVDIGHVGENA